MKKSALQTARASYQPKLPEAIKNGVTIVEGKATQSVADQEAIAKLFPNTYGMPVLRFEAAAKKEYPAINVGVILSGGQAPGGHNVISGLFDGLKALNKESRLFGFLLGPGGLIEHKYMELTADIIDDYRNTGGFDIIGSGRTKLETKDQFDSGLEIIKELGIKAVVIIGGDDSNTNACVLAEYYKQIGAGVQVIGCPKTIDGDLKNEMIESSFGFDTACKVYSEVIGNIQRDCNSAKKYWHFIKLMGRSASHIALECALQTQPNICLISEEIEAKQMTLDDVVNYIAEIVAARAAKGNNFGTVDSRRTYRIYPCHEAPYCRVERLSGCERFGIRHDQEIGANQLYHQTPFSRKFGYLCQPARRCRPSAHARPRPPRKCSGIAYRNRKTVGRDGRTSFGRNES